MDENLKQAVRRMQILIRERNVVANGVFTTVAKKYHVGVRELKKALSKQEKS